MGNSADKNKTYDCGKKYEPRKIREDFHE